jgi:hypothetical protein
MVGGRLTHWAYSFNGKTEVSKTFVAGSSPAGPATYEIGFSILFASIILSLLNIINNFVDWLSS